MNMKITRSINAMAVGQVGGLDVTYSWSHNEGEQATMVYFSANMTMSNARGNSTSLSGNVTTDNFTYSVNGEIIDTATIEAVKAKGLEFLLCTTKAK